MVKNANTQLSAGSQGDSSKENDVKPAEKTTDASKEKTPEQLLAEITGNPLAAQETKADSEAQKPEKVKEPEEKGDETPKPKEEPPKEKSEDGTLENFFEEEEPISYKKTSRFPDIEEGDVDYSGEIPLIKAKHVYEELLAIFGSKEKDPDLSVFLKINNAKPKKANELAKLAGFRNRHHFADAIEEFISAKTQEGQNEVLEREFPEWTRVESGGELPFEIGEFKESEQKSEISGRKFSWSQTELEGAINDHVANNEKISKESILKSVKLLKLLEDFSGMSKKGKPLSATEALKLAIPLSGIEPETPKKETQASLGGVTNVKQPTQGAVADKALLEAAKAMGLDPKKFAEHLLSNPK